MKRINKNNLISLFIIAFAYLNSQFALASGFEKSVLWSGKYSGVANAASSVVTGPESVFFNPAGLGASPGLQLVGNASPTFIQLSGPVMTGTSLTSNRAFLLPFSALASYALTPQLSVGGGYYVAGGARDVYENVDFSGVASGFGALKPTLKSELFISEASLGLGYEIFKGLKVGAAYRILIVNGALGFATASVVGNSVVLSVVNVDNISATRYNGFRAGVQYTSEDSHWGVGASWRSEIQFTGNANLSTSTVTTTGTVTQNPGVAATVGNDFPQQISLGGFFDVVPNTWRLLAEYTFTEYNKNQAIIIGSSTLNTSLAQNWNNMGNYRIATEYMINPLALRLGYVYTTQVVPNSNASILYATPGVGHTIVAGVGTSITPQLSGDVALEYSRASGTVSAAENAVSGDYSSNVYAAHLGVTWKL